MQAHLGLVFPPIVLTLFLVAVKYTQVVGGCIQQKWNWIEKCICLNSEINHFFITLNLYFIRSVTASASFSQKHIDSKYKAWMENVVFPMGLLKCVSNNRPSCHKANSHLKFGVVYGFFCGYAIQSRTDTNTAGGVIALGKMSSSWFEKVHSCCVCGPVNIPDCFLYHFDCWGGE